MRGEGRFFRGFAFVLMIALSFSLLVENVDLRKASCEKIVCYSAKKVTSNYYISCQDNEESRLKVDSRNRQITGLKQLISVNDVQAFSGKAYVEINGNKTFFKKKQLKVKSLEKYKKLDKLGRCGTAIACVGMEIMPEDEREGIGSVRPSGWKTVKYNDIINGNYLYNRCHLLAYCLTGENANTKNLITGTRYLNVDGMLPFEMQIFDYVKKTGNHVLYRVTPIFSGDELVARGVLMEAKSIENSDLEFCVYCYNVQPGVTIDYATGDSYANGEDLSSYNATSVISSNVTSNEIAIDNKGTGEDKNAIESNQEIPSEITYVCNKNTNRFHYPDCASVGQMADHNKLFVTGSRDEVIAMGYISCGNCKP